MKLQNQQSTLSEINVTPLVDVMLVLLIVFMVTTPIMVEELSKKEVEVNLPATRAPAPMKPSDTLIVVRKDRKVTLSMGKGETELADCGGGSAEELGRCLNQLETAVANNPPLQKSDRILVFAEDGLGYSFAVKVFASIKRAGKKRLFLVTNPPSDSQ
ncbi:MAG: biopolymer transporter ExbD [Bradymonadia bacterium]